MKKTKEETVEKAINDVTSTFINYRKENNLKQRDLANIIGTTQQAISRLEKKGINPSINFLEKALEKIGYKMEFKKIKE
ncbi:helix-turn-helix domain-containing protein [Cetobacterium sp.]|uniref:helix-turn-helix domain-containing protein n=1 Tax=Cetobacterium sp. TaxID=2071632 RepID=UPI003F2ABF57